MIIPSKFGLHQYFILCVHNLKTLSCSHSLHSIYIPPLAVCPQSERSHCQDGENGIKGVWKQSYSLNV